MLSFASPKSSLAVSDMIDAACCEAVGLPPTARIEPLLYARAGRSIGSELSASSVTLPISVSSSVSVTVTLYDFLEGAPFSSSPPTKNTSVCVSEILFARMLWNGAKGISMTGVRGTVMLLIGVPT